MSPGEISSEWGTGVGEGDRALSTHTPSSRCTIWGVFCTKVPAQSTPCGLE